MFENFDLFVIATIIMAVSLLIMPYFFNIGPKISNYLAAFRFLLVILSFVSYFYFIFSEYLVYINLCGFYIGCSSEVPILVLQVLAISIFLSGAYIFIFSIIHQKMTVLKPQNKLVTSGPYNFVRHPLYFACIACSLSFAIYAFSLLGFFYVIVLCLVLTNLYRHEEKELIKRFGKNYVNYKRRVPGIFPFKKFM